MEHYIKEKPLFDYLKTVSKPIYMYGMGDGGEKLKTLLDKFNIKLEGIFASDEYVRGQSFLGFTVIKYHDLPPDAIILSAFGIHDDVMLKRFNDICNVKELYSPEMPLFGEMIIFDDLFLKNNIDKMKLAFGLLADDQSKKVFINTINNKLSGKISYLFEMESDKSEIYCDLLHVSEKEIYIDLGAYDGDTIHEFLSYSNNKFERIVGLEPDVKNYKKLVAKTEHLDITILNKGVYNTSGKLQFSTEASRNSSIREDGNRSIEVTTIDELCKNVHPTIIKMDVEGSEAAAICGGINTLKDFKPKLIVSAYHKTGDFFELILLLHDINPDYKFYLRHQPYIPNWETNIIAI